jgi:DNA mismatch repair protein MutS2
MTTTENSPALPRDGFQRALGLLEFDQIRQQLAATTRTVIGAESAGELAPTADGRDVAMRQQETAEARRLLDTTGALELGPVEDLRPAVQRALLGGVLRGEELLHFGSLAAAARWNRNALGNREDLPLLAATAENFPDLPDLESAVNRAIGPSGEVLDDASPELGRLRRDSRSAYAALNDVMQRSLRRYQRSGVTQENIVTERNGRMVLLIKTDFKGQAPGIIHDVSDSGATVFIEPMPAIDLGNRWRETRLAERREEERVLRQLSSLVGRYAEEITLTLHLLGRLDLAAAKGRYGAALRAVPPHVAGLDEPRQFRLTGARHPLLTGEIVPTTINIRSDQSVLLITGPNAGGKTVALKTVGLLAMMALAGLQVPADDADIPLLDGIYADIGDQQSIEQSLSTFSSHIQNLRSIMERVTSNSLVLVDELGTSTDPEEGSALAQAVLSHFQRRGVLMIATTHHRVVAAYAQDHDGMINASVDLDPQTLEPTYRITLGLPGRSYAMTIASRLGLEPEVVEHARSLMSPVQAATEDLLRELRDERHLLEQLHQEAESSLVEARRQQAEVEARLANVEDAKAELVEIARQELQKQITELQDRLKQAERSMQQSVVLPIRPPAADPASQAPDAEMPEPRSLERVRAELNEMRRQVSSSQWQPIPLTRTGWQQRLARGDRVYLRGIPRPVVVVAPPDGEEQVEVLLGTMRAKIPLYQLEGLAGGSSSPGGSLSPGSGTGEGHRLAHHSSGEGLQENRSSQRPGGQRSGIRRPFNPEVDLRGQRVEEALGNVDGLLDTAAVQGVQELRIIHGTGTGALRRAIREYLKDHPLVESSAPAADASGEGVTVVILIG